MSNKKKGYKRSSPDLLAYSRGLFDRYAADFDTLDNKALGVIGIAGLLVGFQAMNVDTTAELLGCFKSEGCICLSLFALVFLVVHAGGLVVCILKALTAFQVRDFEYPGSIKDLLKDANTNEAVRENIIDAYEHGAERLNEINQDKARKLKSSVRSITVAIIALIAYMVFMAIYKCR
jgi:hypothetical protein